MMEEDFEFNRFLKAGLESAGALPLKAETLAVASRERALPRFRWVAAGLMAASLAVAVIGRMMFGPVVRAVGETPDVMSTISFLLEAEGYEAEAVETVELLQAWQDSPLADLASLDELLLADMDG